MHGSLLHGFKQFVIARAGAAEWEAVSRTAGVGSWFKAAEMYPDANLTALASAAAGRWRQPVDGILEGYGAALVPTLMTLYGAFLDPSWRSLDLLERVESVIHRTVRMREPSAAPPRLRPKRVGRGEVHIEYDSERRLCAMAMGICRGVAAHYAEQLAITQPKCRERGDPFCLLVARQEPGGAEPPRA